MLVKLFYFAKKYKTRNIQISEGGSLIEIPSRLFLVKSPESGISETPVGHCGKSADEVSVLATPVFY